MGMMQNTFRMVRSRIAALVGKANKQAPIQWRDEPKANPGPYPFSLRRLFLDLSGGAARTNRYIKGFNREHEAERRRRQIASGMLRITS
jgi:hypothetical protein